MHEQSRQNIARLINELEKVIIGRADTVKLVVTGLVAGGHVLVEDYPGSGKTTLAKTLGRLIDCGTHAGGTQHIAPFRRIQFTPDLLPSDVLGVNIFDAKSGEFRFVRGPVFAHILLADEINRTGPKVQAAFLECMAERQVTLDNVTHPLDQLFFVIGTQNPLDIAGTYPLSIVQLDRFLLKIPMNYVSREDELKILRQSEEIDRTLATRAPVVTRADVLQAQSAANEVKIDDRILDAIVDIAQGSRSSQILNFGASTRAAIMLKRSARAWALVNDRDYVTEDDIKYMTPYVLKHRLRFNPGISNTNEAFQDFMKPFIEKLVARSI
jgi:MoxR-like ATPase